MKRAGEIQALRRREARMAESDAIKERLDLPEEFDVDDEEFEENEDAELTQEDIVRLRKMLLEKRAEVVQKVERHLQEAIGEAENLPDESDQASRQAERAYYMRLADKESKLLRQIDYALSKFPRGAYGVCEGTGEPIGLKRLELRPWTRYSLEYKEHLERQRGRGR